MFTIDDWRDGKHGINASPKKIESPAKLWEFFLEYVEHLYNNDYELTDVVKTGENVGSILRTPKRRAMTMKGFETWLNLKSYIGSLAAYKNNYFNAYDAYQPILEMIKSAIDAHNLDGAAVGALNPALVIRLTGLADKVETTNTNINENAINLENLDEQTLADLEKALAGPKGAEPKQD